MNGNLHIGDRVEISIGLVGYKGEIVDIEYFEPQKCGNPYGNIYWVKTDEGFTTDVMNNIRKIYD